MSIKYKGYPTGSLRHEAVCATRLAGRWVAQVAYSNKLDTWQAVSSYELGKQDLVCKDLGERSILLRESKSIIYLILEQIERSALSVVMAGTISSRIFKSQATHADLRRESDEFHSYC